MLGENRKFQEPLAEAFTIKAPLIPELQDESDLVNTDMNLLYYSVSKPVEQKNVNWGISKFCKAYNLNIIRSLKRYPTQRTCYRWMFGKYKKECPTGHWYLNALDIADKFASDLSVKVQEDIKVMAAVADGKVFWKPNTKRLKK